MLSYLNIYLFTKHTSTFIVDLYIWGAAKSCTYYVKGMINDICYCATISGVEVNEYGFFENLGPFQEPDVPISFYICTIERGTCRGSLDNLIHQNSKSSKVFDVLKLLDYRLCGCDTAIYYIFSLCEGSIGLHILIDYKSKELSGHSGCEVCDCIEDDSKSDFDLLEIYLSTFSVIEVITLHRRE